MKIKSDFVTNSSSSSFVVWGVGEDFVLENSKLCKKIIKNYKKVLEEKIAKENNSWDVSNLEELDELQTDEEKMDWLQDNLYDVFDENDCIEYGGQEYERYFGISPTVIQSKYPDVKFGDVKKFVAEKLSEYFGVEVKESEIQYTEQGWFDG